MSNLTGAHLSVMGIHNHGRFRYMIGVTVAIFFFSGTGNTYWCADRLANSLTENGISARAISIEGVDPSRVERVVTKAEIVGLGWPVYASDLPEPMKQFIGTAGLRRPKIVYVLYPSDVLGKRRPRLRVRVPGEALANRVVRSLTHAEQHLPNRISHSV
jgi:hypothetical protein